MGLHADEVGEEVASGERKVLDDEIERFIRILDSWYGNVSNLFRRYYQGEHDCEHQSKHTRSMMLGRMTFLISDQSSGLNLRLPSLSNSKSFVRRAQSSPNLKKDRYL